MANDIQQQNNQVSTRTPKENFLAIIDAPAVKKRFSEVLQDTAPAFMGSMIELFNGDTYLQKCKPLDIVNEALKAAVLKLAINKSLGFAYIIPYKDKPQMMIGYKGLIQLAMRTGQYRFINADLVYEGEFQKKDKLTGEFDMNGEKKSDKVVGFFAYIELLNGFSKTLYMTVEQITRHAKKYSKTYGSDNGIWQKEFDAMALKTVLRNLLSHYGYLSIEMSAALNQDMEGDSVEEKVQGEIRGNANVEEIKFEEMGNEQQPEDNCPI